jgi:hypothetical protein
MMCTQGVVRKCDFVICGEHAGWGSNMRTAIRVGATSTVDGVSDLKVIMQNTLKAKGMREEDIAYILEMIEERGVTTKSLAGT